MRQRIYQATEPLRTAAPEVGWVEESRLHLTLKFLGEQSADAAGALAGAIREVANAQRALELEVGGLGAFPSRRRPRIIWLGIVPDPRLELLQHDVELACEQLGHPVEGRAFRPHITLGRVKQEVLDARALAAAARTVIYRETAAVDTLDLMESRLTAAGPRYAVVATAALGLR